MALEGIKEAGRGHDQGTNGGSDQRRENEMLKECCSQRLVGDDNMIIEDLMVTMSKERVIVRCCDVIGK